MQTVKVRAKPVAYWPGIRAWELEHPALEKRIVLTPHDGAVDMLKDVLEKQVQNVAPV
jgi:hypothetical protein